MATQSIKIEYESQAKNTQNAQGKSSTGNSNNEGDGLNVNGLALDSLINLLSQSDSKYSTITIKADNSILIS